MQQFTHDPGYRQSRAATEDPAQVEVERLGSSRTLSVDVRVISATNADLAAAVAQGSFRKDLLFRLRTVEIHLPPLADRREDVPALAAHFLERHARRYRKQLAGFTAAAHRALLAHAWPGNVREHDHAVERGVLMARGPALDAHDLVLDTPAGTAPPDPFVPRTLDELPLEEVETIRSAIRVGAMADGNDVDDQIRVVDRVDDTMVTDSNRQRFSAPSSFRHPEGLGFEMSPSMRSTIRESKGSESRSNSLRALRAKVTW